MGSPATKLAANPELAEIDRDSTRDVERSVERRSPIDPTPVATSPVPPRGAVSTLGSHRGAPKGVEATLRLVGFTVFTVSCRRRAVVTYLTQTDWFSNHQRRQKINGH